MGTSSWCATLTTLSLASASGRRRAVPGGGARAPGEVRLDAAWEKTRLIRFGRFAALNRKECGAGHIRRCFPHIVCRLKLVSPISVCEAAARQVGQPLTHTPTPLLGTRPEHISALLRRCAQSEYDHAAYVVAGCALPCLQARCRCALTRRSKPASDVPRRMKRTPCSRVTAPRSSLHRKSATSPAAPSRSAFVPGCGAAIQQRPPISFRRLWPRQRSARLQRKVFRGPAIGAIRIPGHVGVADRDGPFRRVPRHPAIRQAVEHKHAVPHRRRWPAPVRARSIAPSPAPMLHSPCPAARRCQARLRAVSPARLSMPAVRPDAAPAAAHR